MMSCRKYVILLLICWPFQGFARFASNNERKPPEQASSHPWLTEDIYLQLSKRWAHKPLTKRLLHLIFLPATAWPPQASNPSWGRYQGRIIESIHLQQLGVFESAPSDTAANKPWKRLGRLLFPPTRSWVIRQYLCFNARNQLAATQLKNSQEALNQLPYLEKAWIKVTPSPGSNDTVDVLVTTQDAFPIKPGLALERKILTLSHQNLAGLGHTWASRFSYNQRLGYGLTYQIPHIQGSYITGELQYLNTDKKQVKRLGMYRDFMQCIAYAGGAEISYTKQRKERLLDGHTAPVETPYGFHYQHLWLGKACQASLVGDKIQGQFFLTGRIAHQAFTERPMVRASFNRAFHSYTFVLGSWGFARSVHHQARFIHDVGCTEAVLGGAKLNLIGGYQLGEFIKRPYVQLDVAQAKYGARIGYLATSLKLGGFLHNQAIEQGIMQLTTRYFTPLLPLGSHAMRQFVELSYLAGLNMFTGELISTHTKPVPKAWADPFPAGTKRLKLQLATAWWLAKRLAGCQVAILGFIDAVHLRDADGSQLQSSFCEAWGVGFRLGHERFTFGTLQVKLSYRPLVQAVALSVSNTIKLHPDDLAIGEPGTIPFCQY